MTQYRILSHLNFSVLTERKTIPFLELVNYALTAGCQLQGGVSVREGYQGSTVKHQAILGTKDQLKKLNSIVESKINLFFKELLDDIDKKEKQVLKLNNDEIKESKERLKSAVPEEEAIEIESKVKDLEGTIRNLESEKMTEYAKRMIPHVTARFLEISKEIGELNKIREELRSEISYKRYYEKSISSSEEAIEKITSQSDKERKVIQTKNSLSLKKAYI